MLARTVYLLTMGSGALAAMTSVAVVGFSAGANFSGFVAGTGAAGTTFFLEGEDVFGTSTIPFTMTVVEDASELLETVDVPSASLVAEAECSIVSGSSNASGRIAECQDIAGMGAMTATILVTASLSAIEVPVSLVPSTNATANTITPIATSIIPSSRSISIITPSPTQTSGSSLEKPIAIESLMTLAMFLLTLSVFA